MGTRRLILVLCLAGAALADPVTDAADKALEVFRAKGDLTEFARRDEPDPWLVADELCARGEHDAADAFAKAAPRKDVEKLPDYVASRRGSEPDAAARAVIREMGIAVNGNRFPEAVGLAEKATARGDPIASIRILTGLALALNGIGKLAESAAAYREAGKRAWELGWLARASLALQESGQREADRFDYPAALAAWGELLEIEEARGDRKGLAIALGSIGMAQQSLGRYPEALSNLERAMRLAEEEGDRKALAACLSNLGNIHHSTGRYEAALACYERSLKLSEELADRAGVAACLTNIGLLRDATADYAGALAYHERALALLEELGERALASGALVNIGMAHDSLGNYPKALEFYERGLREAEATGQKEFAAIALGNIGGIHKSLGDYPAALSCQERALEKKKEIGDRGGIAKTLAGIGIIHKALGEYGKARSFLTQALRMQEELGDRAGIAEELGLLGVLHQELGDYPQSLDCEERALALFEELGARAGVATSLLRLGVIHHALGDDLRALKFYRRALDAAEAIGRRSTAACAAVGLGSVHSCLGEDAIALSFQRRALELSEELGDRSGVALALANIGACQCALGDFTTALQFQERSLRLREEIGDRVGVARTLSNIGFLHLRTGEPEAALSFQQRAIAEAERIGSREVLASGLEGVAWGELALGRPAAAVEAARRAVGIVGQLATGLAEEEGARTRERFTGIFDAGVQAALALGDPEQLSFFVESGRAATLLDMLEAGEALRATAVPAELRAAEAAARAEESLALARHRRAIEKGDRGEIREARRQLDAARERIADAILRIQRQAPAGAAAVHPGTDTLETIRRRLREGETLLLYLFCNEEAATIVVTRGKAEIVRLGEARAIEEACADVATEGAGKLRRLVVDPLRLPAGARVLVSPAACLCYAPFSLLLGGREVVCIPSATIYGLLLDEAGKRGDGVLAFGNPDGTLPASGEEAEAVGDLALLGGDASEPALPAALAKRPRWRAVHFACHGIIDPNRPRLSSLALSGGDTLTTLEVFRLKVPADLVVLSACETAKGRVYQTEGVVGFVRGFMFAGAARVLVSLWQVDDEATNALMVRFYELWKGGMPCARALLQSQRFVASQERWRDPKYWAAWQLWGLAE